MSNDLVIVVGAGIGGLSAAISLASSGARVCVLERSSRSGGKIRQEWVGGRAIDAGPTVLTMRWVFDELFESAGHRFDDHVRLRRAPRIARHFWSDGSRLDLYDDVEQNAQAIGDLAGAEQARGYLRFAQHTQRTYETVKEVFLRADRPTLTSTLAALTKVGPAALWRVEGHRTMWNALRDYFSDPRLLQLFGRYATYAGSSPFLAPATLNVIAHVEQCGVWLAEGGMRSIAEACESVARKLGVEVRYAADVEEVTTSAGRVTGVRLSEGEVIRARAVLFNGDPAAVASGLLGTSVRPAASAPRHRSLSAFTIADVVPPNANLDYHNVFFSDDYEREFIELFHERVVPSYPTVYVCAQDRAGFGTTLGSVPSNVAVHEERLFLLINAPSTVDQVNPTERVSCRTSTLETLQRCGWDLQLSKHHVTTTPEDFARRFPGSAGSLYGPASHGMMSPMAKVAARSSIPGLFFAGGGAHPGAGVPMAASSGLLAARAIRSSFDSTPQFRTMATNGGTSISSATTGATRSS